ncbi:MAG: DUF6573 family protein [Candidatus Methylomirabilota bacterium]
MREGDTVKIGDEEFEVLSVYTRAQAIEDGVLIDVTNLAPDLVQNAGIKLHVAMTSEVWDEYVEVPEGLVGRSRPVGRRPARSSSSCTLATTTGARGWSRSRRSAGRTTKASRA